MRPSTDFKKLRDEWYLKLKDTGFEDIELNGRLKQKDSRTRIMQMSEVIQSRISSLEDFLHSRDGFHIPQRHQRILTLYLEGLRFKKIAEMLGVHRWTVWYILKQYR